MCSVIFGQFWLIDSLRLNTPVITIKVMSRRCIWIYWTFTRLETQSCSEPFSKLLSLSVEPTCSLGKPLYRPSGCFKQTFYKLLGKYEYSGFWKRDPFTNDNNWAASWQNDCAPSEDSDQPGHPPSLISVFDVRFMGFFMRTAKILIRLGGCPGWSESSLGAHAALLVLSRGGSYEYTRLGFIWCVHDKQWGTQHCSRPLADLSGGTVFTITLSINHHYDEVWGNF